MGALRGLAAIAGTVELRPERKYAGPTRFTTEQWADLAAMALSDAGVESGQVDGLVCMGDVYEASQMVPALLAEHCGWNLSFAERVDLGGASAVGMVWRAAAAIEAGLCRTVVCALPARPRPAAPQSVVDLSGPLGYSDDVWGSNVSRFEVPYGNVGPTTGFALIASRYDAEVGGSDDARAKVVVDQRTSAAQNPEAVHYQKPVTREDVLGSQIVVPPLHILEIVMPCSGGAAVVVTRKDELSNSRRPVVVTGFGEATSFKTPTYSRDVLDTPLRGAAERAFQMSGRSPREIDMVQMYDAYSISVILALEAAGFCGRGEGSRFVLDHDLAFSGDFPCNTNGGQIGLGQAGNAGGMTHVIEAVRQIQGTTGVRQLRSADSAFVSGSGGSMAAQSALILEGI